MVKIYGVKQRLNPIKRSLSDIIHQAMMDVLGLPEGKRAHRFFPMEREDFYYPHDSSDAYTVIEISLIQGRTEASKKKLIMALFSACESGLNLSPVDVEITITEQPAHCWGFRGITGDDVTDLKYRIDV